TWLLTTGTLILVASRRKGWGARRAWALWALVAVLPAYATWRGLAPAVGFLAARDVPPASATAGVWQAQDLPGNEGALRVNGAGAVASGRAGIAAPRGGAMGPDSHVDVRQLTVSAVDPARGQPGTARRQWLYLRPPSSVTLDVALPA